MRQLRRKNPVVVTFSRHNRRGLGWRLKVTTTMAALVFALAASAQDPPAEPGPFEKQSVALRTALHYDPALEIPLKKLVELYREAGRASELKSIYEAHISQFPADAGAKAVLIRIYRHLEEPQAATLAKQAVGAHPDNAFLHFLHFEELIESGDPEALRVLAKAIELEPRPDRKLVWIDRLLADADATGERALAEEQLRNLRQATGEDAAALLELGKKMHRFGFHEMGLETLAQAEALRPVPETNVEIQMLAARMEAALDRNEAAGERLENLLGKVAPDYWRRAEISSLRVHLLDSNAARESLLEQARQRLAAEPENAGAALDLVELLEAAGLRAEAADVLVRTSKNLPHVEALEKKALEVLDRLGNDEKTITFLEAKLEKNPERQDLRYRLVKALYLAGDPNAAAAEMRTVLASLDRESALDQRLDLGRFLRRMNLAGESVEVLESFVEEAPERLDVRRELAEAYLAVGKRDAAREAISAIDAKSAAIENFLDMVQFLVGRDFLSEARRVLEERLEREEDNLDLRLQLVNVLGRLGDERGGREELSGSRELADTAARYRQWLEAGMRFHEEFDTTDLFFDSEQHEFLKAGDEESWDKEKISRFLTLCEVGELNRQRERVAHLLRSQLEGGDLPPDLRVEVRRLLVRTLRDSQAHALEVESQLESLLEEDPARDDEYRLRKALLYHGNQRPDLSRPLLDEVALDEVRDAELLKSAYPVYIDFGLSAPAISALRRLTVVEPGNRQHWERLLNLLAITGQEVEFRKAIREILASIERLELSESSVEALRKHRVDSYWRSIAREIDSEDLAGVSALLDALERYLWLPEDRIWALWTRAFVLNRMGREDSRDAAVARMIELAKQNTGGESEPMIAFPDGLAIGLEAARQILTEPPQSRTLAGEPAGELSDELSMRWAFESDPGTAIVQILPAGERILFLDSRRTVYCVDRLTGKVRWQRSLGNEAASPPAYAGNHRAPSITLRLGQSGQSFFSRSQMAGYRQADHAARYVHRPPALAGGKDGRFYAAQNGQVKAFDVVSGELQWVAPVFLGDNGASELAPFPSSQQASVASPRMELEAIDGQVLCFDPEADLAAAIDAATGKLVWTRRVEEGEADGEGAIKSALNSGGSFGAGRMMVYGSNARILDARTGDTEWEFSNRESLDRFPLRLNAASEEEAQNVADLSAGTVAGRGQMPVYFVDHLDSGGGRLGAVDSFLQYRGALVAPAVEWASERVRDGQARMAALSGRRLLLMGPDGVDSYSLDLPIASRRFDVSGVYLGGNGNRACFLGDDQIVILDLQSGEQRTLTLSGQETGTRVEAFVHGHHVYACTKKGIRCWNLNSGRRIFEQPWPPLFDSYAGKHSAFEKSNRAQVYWQGVAQSAGAGNGTALVCYPVRSTAGDGLLYVLIDDGSVAALGKSKQVASR